MWQVMAVYEGSKGVMVMMLKEFKDEEEAEEMLRLLNTYSTSSVSYRLKRKTIDAID